MNNDQFNSVKAGDYYCDNPACEGPKRAKFNTHSYWWKRELRAPVVTGPPQQEPKCKHLFLEPPFAGYAYCPTCRCSVSVAVSSRLLQAAQVLLTEINEYVGEPYIYQDEPDFTRALEALRAAVEEEGKP